MSFRRMCSLLAAKVCYEGGQSVTEIARSARKSKTTIYRWLAQGWRKEINMTLNYAIQCTDVLTGKKGTFGFDTDEYLNADEPLQFKAKTPIFDGLDPLFGWAKESGVELFFVPVNWQAK